MTRQELEKRLGQNAEDRNYSGLADDYWGTWVDAGEEVVGLVLVCQEFQGPYSHYTHVLPPDDSQEWQGLTDIWDVQWRTVYQVVEAEYTRQSSDVGQDAWDAPQQTDCTRWECQIVDALDDVEQVLEKYGKRLVDIVPMTIARVPIAVPTAD